MQEKLYAMVYHSHSYIYLHLCLDAFFLKKKGVKYNFDLTKCCKNYNDNNYFE